MGNDVVFFILLLIFILILIQRDSLSSFLFEKLDIYISPKALLYIATILLVILMTLGILFDNTKEKFSNISDSYNQMRPNATTSETKNKPHKWFDIDFDSIFPWK